MRNYIKHLFKRHLCVNNTYIDDSKDELMPILKCERCDREIGFIYPDGSKWRVFIHNRFKRYRIEIERWVHEHTKDGKNIANSYEQKWEELLCNLKQWRENYIYPVGCEE